MRWGGAACKLCQLCHASNCAYDSTTHDLVGVARYNDTPGPCSDPSYDAIAGRIPSDTCLLERTDCGDLSVAGAPQ